jgi:hypothetical protein
MKSNEFIVEKWSQKYKSSINCSHPKGFSQRAHCAGKKKHNESIEMEMVCEDCGMCETHGNVMEIKKGQKDSNGYTKCWPGKHAEGTKKSAVTGKQVRNCVPNESIAEGNDDHIWGPQGNFAGDKPINLGGDTVKRLGVGDIVSYFGQKAKILAQSKPERKYSRIEITKGMGSITKDVLTSDLKRLSRDMTEGLSEMDNRTSSGDRREKRNNSPEAKAKRDKELQNLLKDTSPKMRKKLRLPEPKEQGVTEGLYSLEQAHAIFDDFEQAMADRGLTEDIFDFFTDEEIILETAAWRRSAGKSKKGGLNAKGVASYRRENPGSKLQMAVTTKPSKLKPGSKAAKRRKSFCARMGGVKGPMKKPNGKPTRKALALRKWNC